MRRGRSRRRPGGTAARRVLPRAGTCPAPRPRPPVRRSSTAARPRTRADRSPVGRRARDFARRLSGYHRAMRRLLIGLALTLLLVVSIGVGVTVARWPQPHLWP